MSERDSVSFSGVMVVLWIRNLSLHFVANGGSSFMACSMTGSPPHTVDAPVRDTWRIWTNHATHLAPQRSDQAPPDPNLASHNTASDDMKLISTLASGAKEPKTGTDLWSSGLNFERNRLHIVVGDLEGTFCGLSKRP